MSNRSKITKLIKKASLFLLISSIVISGVSIYPERGSAADAPPTFTGVYQKDNHVKVEWSTQMSDADILTKTGFESGEEIPNYSWQGYGGQSVKISPTGGMATFTPSTINGRGNFYNYPQTSGDSNIHAYSGKSVPGGVTLSANYSAYIDTASILNSTLTIRTGWIRRGVETIDYSGNPVVFAGNINMKTLVIGDEIPVSTPSGVAINIPNMMPLNIVTSHDKNYNYAYVAAEFIASRQVFKVYYVGGSNPSPLGQVTTPLRDTFVLGEPLLSLNEFSYNFPQRELSKKKEWVTFSSNVYVADSVEYDYLLRGIIPTMFLGSDGDAYIDNVKIGYATEAELFRNGSHIYKGYLSDYEDTAAIDQASPTAPANLNVSIGAGRNPVITWNPSIDNGTTYNYQIKGYPKSSSPTALSSNMPVTVTSGIKGYAVVIDQNPNTIPSATLTTTSTSYTAPSVASGNFFVHVAAIDNQGNISGVSHASYTDKIKPELTLNSNETVWTKDPIRITATARDNETGIKRIQLPTGIWETQNPVTTTVNQNGNYTFVAEDNAENQTQLSAVITKIDTEKPTISFTPSGRSWSSKDIEVDIQYEDLLSGLDPNQRLYKVTNSATPPTSWDVATTDKTTVQITNEGGWYIHAKATDQVGNSFQAVTSVLQLQHQPLVPTLQHNGTDQTSTQLEWSLPSGSTLADGYSYLVQNTTTGQSWEVNYPTNTFTDSSLVGGKAYQYQVKAKNHVGESAFSNIVDVLTLPDAPTEIKVEKDGRLAERALVTITPVESATSYRITATNNGTGQEVFNQTVTDTVYQPVMNLEPGTVYDIAVSAMNGTGEGKTTHRGYLSLPDVPGGFKSIQIDENSIDLQWNTVTSATYYVLDRDLRTIFGGQDTVFQDVGLESGTSYDYRISGENGTGFGDYALLNGIWTLPASVSVLDSVYTSTNEIKLTWTSVVGAEGYILTVDGQQNILINQGETEYTVTGLDPGTIYDFGIRPINRSGMGKVKNLITTTIPDVPTNLHVINIGEQGVTIKFNAVPGATKYQITLDGKKYEIADTELQVVGLIGGHKYDYSVSAGNMAGYGGMTQGELLTLPYAPNVKLVSVTAESFTVSWNPVDSATEYVITDLTGKELDVVQGTKYTRKGISPGEVSTIFVAARNINGEGSKAIFNQQTLPNTGNTTTSAPITTDNEVEFSWDAVPGAEGYKIIDGNGNVIANTNDNTIKIGDLDSSDKHENWKVIPYNSVGDAEEIHVPTFETMPSDDFVVTVSADKVKELTFKIESELKNETYVIGHKDKEIYRGTDKQFTLIGLKDDSEYTFNVHAENGKGEKSKDKVITGKTKYVAPTNTSTSSGGGSSNNNFGYENNKNTNTDQPTVDKSDGNDSSNKNEFIDIENSFARDEIFSLYSKGILKGVSANEFAPKRSITRMEFVAIIVRALELDSNSNEQVELTFKDIKSNAWYIPELNVAISNHVAKGFSDTEFRPNDYITREQASKMLGNVLYEGFIPEGNVVFKDKDTISTWAKDEVTALAIKNLVNGYTDGFFRPKTNLTREESAALIYRTIMNTLK